LTARGHEIVRRNFRKKCGEIDIITLHGNEVVFAEVKTRKFGSLLEGADSVTLDKRRKLFKTAKAFLADNPRFCNMNVRFDVAAVTVTAEDLPSLLEIEYCEDAFNPIFL
jgi:putative endonuclease